MEIWQTVLSIFGGIAIIGSASAALYRWIRPAIKIKLKVMELERKHDADYKLLQELDQTMKMQTRLLLAMINHQIDGNEIEKMKTLRDELQESFLK